MAGKGEIVERVAQEAGLTKAEAGQAVDAFTSAISARLAAGESVTVTGFGTFKVSPTNARQGRNPATGAAMTIAAGKRIGFSAGSKLAEAVKGSH